MQESCGCQASPRRHCDICYEERRVFLACSGACLDAHLRNAHACEATAAARAKALLTRMNAEHPDSSESFAAHRVRLMDLVSRAEPGGTVLVLGVGNASDLDLPFLAERFREVHLVDLDGAALERARARQSEVCRQRLVLHADIDLSGLLEYLEAWGDAFPGPPELGATAVAAARRLVTLLGQHDVVLSTCVLSQLGLPFRRSWVAPASTWANLSAAISAVHLATVAGCTGRRGILAFDVQQQDGRLSPEPEQVLAQLRSPGLASLVANPTLSEPWRWNLGDVEQLVYAVEFAHPR
jgi:hypothetical protein